MAISFISLKERCDESLQEYFCILGNLFGWISSVIWFNVLFPQIIKNYNMKSVEGLSLLWALLNFLASFVNLFFVFQNSLPLFGKISAIYMPTIEFLLILQFYIYGKYERKLKNTYFFSFLFIIISVAITNFFLTQYYINYLEWIAIILWSIETFPQIYLNFKNKSTMGISKISQAICFLGKTSDIMQSYLLKIPIQYRFLAFFSSSSAYIGNIQVIYYYNKIENYQKIKEDPDLELEKIYKNNEVPQKHELSLLRIICMITVFLFLIIAMIGFIIRTENFIVSMGIVLGFYILIWILKHYSSI